MNEFFGHVQKKQGKHSIHFFELESFFDHWLTLASVFKCFGKYNRCVRIFWGRKWKNHFSSNSWELTKRLNSPIYAEHFSENRSSTCKAMPNSTYRALKIITGIRIWNAEYRVIRSYINKRLTWKLFTKNALSFISLISSQKPNALLVLRISCKIYSDQWVNRCFCASIDSQLVSFPCVSWDQSRSLQASVLSKKASGIIQSGANKTCSADLPTRPEDCFPI